MRREIQVRFLQMRHGLLAVLAILALQGAIPATAAESSWYEQTQFACSDPLDLVATLSGSTWFSRGVRLKAPAVTQGLVYVEMSKEEFDRISAADHRTEVVESVPLTQAKAASFRQILANRAENASVPGLTQVAFTGLPSYFLSWTGGLILDAVFSRLFADLDQISVNARVLRELTAPGGNLSSLVTTGTRDGGEYMMRSYLYTVRVGEEERRYLLSSCVYAAKLLYKQIETRSPLNNKRLTLVGENHWRVFDIQDARFEGDPWTEFLRDKEYLYLESRSPSGLVRRWRVSLRGGKWQAQRDDGNWGTLYAETVAS
jgi:hypothetical protein